MNRVKEKLNSLTNKGVQLIAVSKGRTEEEIRTLYDQGIRDFGENRVQEFLAKVPLLPEDIRWHFVGHLQRNKVKSIVQLPQLALIQSVDSLRLAEKIHQEAQKAHRQMPVLLQVNIAREPQKYGFSPESLLEAFSELQTMSGLRIKGLMMMAPFTEEPEEVRRYFRATRELAQSLRAEKQIALEELSMGMSQDYQVAMEEGSTMIRLGRILFQKEGEDV